MIKLQIKKKPNNVWQHFIIDGKTFILSDCYCKTNGDYFRVVEIGGSQRNEFLFSEIEVYDIGGIAETFASALSLMQRLKSLNYVGFIREGDVVTADIISSDPSNAAIIGTDGGLFVPIINADSDSIIYNAGFELIGNDLTINSGWVWNINGLEYTNLSISVLNIPFATAGSKRIDLIVANNNNSFTRVAGVEDLDPTAPTQPNDTILVSFINISDGVISDPTTPIIGEQFIKKSDAQPFQFLGSGSDAIIPLSPLGSSEIRLQNPALVSIAGFDLSLITGVPTAEVPYQNKPYQIRNLTGNPVVVKNESTTADTGFFLTKGIDLIIPVNESLFVKYDVSGMVEAWRSWESGNVNADNGLNTSDDPKVVELGGDLTKNTTINVFDKILGFLGNAGKGFFFMSNQPDYPTTFGSLEIGNGDGSGFLKRGFKFFNNKTIFKGDVNGGIDYDADYSSTYTYRSLVDKGWVLNNAVSQLQKVTELGYSGWRLLGQDPSNYGNTGNNSVDLSISNATSSTRGATGNTSFAEGFNTTASGGRSHAQNYNNVASGDDSHAEGSTNVSSGTASHSEGLNNVASGRYTHAGGHLNKAQTYSETVIGFCAKEIIGNENVKDAIDPVFRVGIGNSNIDKFDGFGVYKNGAIYLYPSSLSTVTNTVKTGFLKLDENFVLNIHDGTQWKKVTDPSVQQKTITTSRSALASDNGCLIKIKGNATYTIDQSTLPTGWNVIIRSFTGATGTFVASAGTTFDAPNGLILKPLKMCSIIKDSDDNKILINGETSIT